MKRKAPDEPQVPEVPDRPGVPKWMTKDAGRGLEKLDSEDYAWLGEDGDIDVDKILADHGFDPRSPLEFILLAIIDAHPSTKKGSKQHRDDREDRLDRALAALRGSRRKRGMKDKDDYDLLRQVAARFLKGFWDDRASPELAPIIRDCIACLPSDDHRRHMAEDESVIKRLQRKFDSQKDLLLARVSSEYEPQRMYMLQAVRKILLDMKTLGILVDLNSLRFKPVSRDL